MFMNYMDYTDDRCMNLFTEGQKLRMKACLSGFRSALLTSNGCVPALTAEDCDTLDNISGGDGLVYYFASEIDQNETGYFTGTNSKKDRAFAEKYTATTIRILNTLRFDFAVASSNNSAGFVTATVWDDDGLDGSPGTVLAQQPVFISTIISDVANFTFTDVEFENPAAVTGDYFVGFQLYENPGDTISVNSNQFDETNVNTGWLKRNSGNWERFDVAHQDSALSLAIRPIACLDVGIQTPEKPQLTVYPNPGNGTFFIENAHTTQAIRWQLITIDGRIVSSGSTSKRGLATIETGVTISGIYFLVLINSEEYQTHKVIIAN